MINKNTIVAFILGGIIFGIIGVYAGAVTSSNVSYGSTSVEGALNDLYSKASYGNAAASHILSGQTALVGGNKVTGTMPNQSGKTVGLSGYETVSIMPHPADNSQGLVTITNQYLSYGYYDTTTKFQTNIANLNAANIKAGVAVGQVNGNSSNSIVGTYTSDATANASQILSGQTAYVNGNKVTGTMPVWAATYYDQKEATSLVYGTYSENSNPYLYFGVLPNQYVGGIIWVRASANSISNTIGLTANKIMPGNTILGVSSSVADRGLAQYGNWGCGSDGCGSGNDAYYAINSLPEGYYHSDGNSWAPEARINANTLRSVLGVSADKIAAGQSIAGVTGTNSGWNNIKVDLSNANYGGATCKATIYVNNSSIGEYQVYANSGTTNSGSKTFTN